KYKLELLLIKEGLWDVVSGTLPSTADAAWLLKDGKAKATIGLLVEDDQLIHIRNATSARAAWTALKEYHQKSSLSSKVFLLKRLCRLTLEENGNVEEHLNLMAEIEAQLSAIGQGIQEDLFIALILSSLPESYNSLISGLESRPEKDLTLSLVKNKLLDDYRRRTKNVETCEKVLKTHNGGDAEKSSQVYILECYFCKKKGHVKKHCYRYKAWKQKHEKANKVTENDTFCFSIKAGNIDKGAWYIDSGATSHMTNDKQFFEELYTDIKDKVTMANGKNLKVEGKGSGMLRCLTNAGKEKIITEEQQKLLSKDDVQTEAEIELMSENNERTRDGFEKENSAQTPRRSERTNKGVLPCRLGEYAGITVEDNIAASIAILSRKMQTPTERDWTEAKRVARYLKGTVDYTLKLGNTGKGTEGLISYADADWTENKDDRKSNNGYIFQYHGSTISWASRKQSCVALSSAEAEYIALSEACQEGLWLAKVLKDLHEKVEFPLQMNEDNQACIKLVENDKFSKRTKHIDVRYHLVKDLNAGNKIVLKYCKTNNMIADLLTKPLRHTRLKELTKNCGLIQSMKDVDVEEECR
ncbi:hypothetical protein KPH14_011325, partial [Odynerus spinipes]